MVGDIFPDSSAPAARDMRGLVPRIKAFILWLGGSLAGITAMLYAAGYLVTRGHLSLLGLHGIVDFDHDYFIQEGSKFLLVIGYSYAPSVVLPLLALVGVASVVLLLLKVATRKAPAQRLYDRLKAFLLHVDRGGMFRIAAFAALLFVFLSDVSKFLTEFQAPLCVANLLYADSGSGHLACSSEMIKEKNSLEAAILKPNNNSASVLYERFSHLLFATVKTALLAYLIWQVVKPWPGWRLWLVAPPLVALCLYTVSLPLDYAVLQRPVSYPRITLTLGGESASAINGPLFLISKTASDFVIWDSSVRRLLWIPSGNVKRVDVIGVGNLFTHQQDGPANTERKR